MLFHDSHDSRYRDPVIPVCAGEKLTLRFLCDESDTVILRLWDGEEHLYPMKSTRDHLFEVELTLPERPMLAWYHFIIPRQHDILRYGASDELGGVGCACMSGEPRGYQLTVYDPAYYTPAFLRKGIMYQIFPDRFAHGEDPKETPEEAQERAEAIAQYHPDAVWHETWQERPFLMMNREGTDNEAVDFFGGNLYGIIEKLDELKEFGVTLLYLNPVFQSHSNHRYDTGSYEEIDPILGSQSTFDRLIKEARARGIRVILDGVFSHTGSDSKYFNREGRYPTLGAYQSEESPYAPWYTFYEWPNRYNRWWCFDTLPALDKANPEYRRYLMKPRDGILPHWIDRGARGWRLDVADELPVDLLRLMRRAVKGAHPDAALIGEVWEDASNKISYGQLRCYCLGDMLDSVMNYPLRRAVIDFFTRRCDAYHLSRVLNHQREVYPTPFLYSLMNLLGSHDRMRILNAMAGYDMEGITQMPREESEKVTLTEEQLALSKKRYLEALRLICLLPGVPTVYYGDEIGMTGMADPWNRAPYDEAHGDEELRSAVSALLKERKASPMLQTGFVQVEALDADTLRITRSADESGRDAFGDPLEKRNREAVVGTISRKGL